MAISESTFTSFFFLLSSTTDVFCSHEQDKLMLWGIGINKCSGCHPSHASPTWISGMIWSHSRLLDLGFWLQDSSSSLVAHDATAERPSVITSFCRTWEILSMDIPKGFKQSEEGMVWLFSRELDYRTHFHLCEVFPSNQSYNLCKVPQAQEKPSVFLLWVTVPPKVLIKKFLEST